MRSFGRSFELWFVSVTFAASVAPCGASVVLDAPGHAAFEGVAVTARGGEPGAAWHIEDWLGREVEDAAGAFDERGETTLPPLKAGYYRLLGESQISNPKSQDSDCFATLAVVAPATPRGARGEDPTRPFPGGGAAFFAADSAASYIAPGAFDCPWNGGDAIRTIADLAALAGIRHIRAAFARRPARLLPLPRSRRSLRRAWHRPFRLLPRLPRLGRTPPEAPRRPRRTLPLLPRRRRRLR